MNISKKLFYLLVFLLPVNLGKHFILYNSYVRGLLIDYLVPVVYVQDLLVVLILISWLVENRFRLNIFKKELFVFFFFLFSLFLSVLVSNIFLISLVSFVRTLLYSGMFLYMLNTFDFKKDFLITLKTLSLSMFLVSILGIIQFVFQGSVFDNYLFFGEQPYSASTQGITLENLFGSTKVPSYGLFRHPNILGGMLSILLVWVYTRLKISKVYQLIFFIMFISLVLTFSVFSYISFALGIILYSLKRRNLIYITLFLVFLFSLLIPFLDIPLLKYSPSFTRRGALLNSSYSLISSNILYGVGFNSMTTVIENNLPYMGVVRFVQPVHQLFVLIFTESGLLSGLFFISFVLVTLYKTKNYLVGVLLFQLLFLSFFDHYFWTIHQTHLFMWILFGINWTSDKYY